MRIILHSFESHCLMAYLRRYSVIKWYYYIKIIHGYNS